MNNIKKFEDFHKITESISEDQDKVIVKRKMGFDFKEVGKFDSLEDAKKYMDGIIKRIARANAKANKDNRPNAFGAQELPWFMVDGEIYDSPFDGRLKKQ